jgi:SH3 domain protein
MKRTALTLAPLLALAATVATAESQRYIDDEIAVTVRAGPSNNADYLGVVRSGDEVTLIESMGPESFARIRTASGTEGWVTARFLTETPAAATRLAAVESALEASEAEAKTLQATLTDVSDELAALKPAAELAEDNAALRARIAELERDNAEVVQRYSEQKSRRKNMLTAAGLIGAGVLGGLVLPWLGRSTRRRRYSDF